MTYDIRAIIAYFRKILQQYDDVTFALIDQQIENSPFHNLSDEDRERVRKTLQSSFDIKQSRGARVISDYNPWLLKRMGDIKFYYWERLRDYFLDEEILAPNVVSTLDHVSNEILDYCGDPKDCNHWSRRGMVMGHVQSGKTTNYTALICKAADAGYRIIILLAGLSNLLRSQTQRRLDETFIGKRSIFYPDPIRTKLGIQGYAAEVRVPIYGTTRDQDFNRVVAQSYGVRLASTNEPTLFVTKKHKGTLENLRDWIMDQNAGELVPEPLLLIDDEADNASINTSSNPNRSTAINSVIREILQLFSRSSYVGYTATPFANIFIEPNSNDEMLGDELFPRNFIKALDAPSNYVGASRVFSNNGDLRGMVKVIDDFSHSIPLVQPNERKSEYPIGDIPLSLKEALRVFLLALSVRHLRGDGNKHCTMMINVSRFNEVQDRVAGIVYGYLEHLKNSVAVNARSEHRESDARIVELMADFVSEFGGLEFDVEDVLGVMHEAIRAVRVVTVNMRGGSLDYEQNGVNGLHVIAVGGFALSRGLTLEGLTVSYIVRNASASDTLMQMARWFGYRHGYMDLCRLYLPESSLDHYDQIHIAMEELSGEIRTMEALERTPQDFGLKVRQSPTSIRITAANKMRSASEIQLAQDYSGRHVEGHALFNDQRINSKHLDLIRCFMLNLGDPESASKLEDPKSASEAICWSSVPGSLVIELIQEFKFPPMVTDMAKISLRNSLVEDYMADRLSNELALWDVYVPLPKSSRHTDNGIIFGNRTLNLRLRGQGKVQQNAFRFYGSKNRVADPRDARFNLSCSQLESAKSYETIEKILGDRKYCLVRDRPLLILHIVSLGEDIKPSVNLQNPVVTLSLCLPESKVTPLQRTYQVNSVFRDALRNETRDEADDDEEYNELN